MKRITLNANKLSLAVSFLSFTTSIIAICIAVKINNQVIYNHQINGMEYVKKYDSKDDVVINEIPDTTIIRKDGSKVEIRSYKANDSLNGIIMNNDKTNGNKIDDEKIAFDGNEVVSVRNEIKEKKQEINKQRNENINNNIKLTLPKNIEKLSQEGVISGKYVIQTGAFKVKNQAQKQCEKIRKNVNLKDKQCQFVFKNNQYRVIIFPFENKNVADEFSKILSSKNFPVLVKKNI